MKFRFLLLVLSAFSLLSNVVYADCSKEEIIEFLKLGFSKEQTQEICNETFIKYDESVGSENLQIDNLTFSEKLEFGLISEESIILNQNHQLNIEIGVIRGESSLSSKDNIYQDYTNDLSYKLSGNTTTLVYHFNFYKLLIGAGYHNFILYGKSNSVNRSFLSNNTLDSYNITIQLKTEKLDISGFFVSVGYEINLTENIELSPQLRWGVANQVLVDQISYLDISTTSNSLNQNSVLYEKLSSTEDIKILHIPIIYRLETFGVGLNLSVMQNEFEYKTGESSSKYKMGESLSLFLGRRF